MGKTKKKILRFDTAICCFGIFKNIDKQFSHDSESLKAWKKPRK